MGTAIVEWATLDAPGAARPPPGPLLVRGDDGHHYVAEFRNGQWWVNGAPGRVIYGITGWAEIKE